jgi:GNAT superfamily N-acetyltransferase
MPAQNTDTQRAARTAVVVRDAELADRADMREVVEAAYQPFAAVLPSQVFDRYLDDLLDFDGHARRGQLVVAEVDGRIRGSAAFYPNTFSQGMGWPPGWAGGRAMAVHPAARRHGVARAMLADSERRARNQGARVFAFHTATFMTEAIALYEGLGYCRVPHFDLDLTAHYGLATPRPIMAIAYRRNLRDGSPCPGGVRSEHRRPAIARASRRPR